MSSNSKLYDIVVAMPLLAVALSEYVLVLLLTEGGAVEAVGRVECLPPGDKYLRHGRGCVHYWVVFTLSAVFSDWCAGVTEGEHGINKRTRKKISADTVRLLNELDYVIIELV